MTIHKEGRTLLVILLIVFAGILYAAHVYTGGSGIIWTLSIVATVVIYLLILQFFRSPSKPVSEDYLRVLAPADGKVVVIEKTVEQEYLKEERIQISIFMSPVNVHVNRMPIKGIVEYFRYHAGKYLVAWHPKSSTENERTTMVISSPTGAKLLVRQIAGALARRIKYYVKQGDSLNQGEEFGFIKFGSRVDVFLPLDATVKVAIGQKTVGGITELAELAPEQTGE